MSRPPWNRRRLGVLIPGCLTLGMLLCLSVAWIIQNRTLRGDMGNVTMQMTRLTHDGLIYREWRVTGQRRYSVGWTQWELLMEGWTPESSEPAPGWRSPERQPAGAAAGFPAWGPSMPLQEPDVFRQVTGFGWPRPVIAHDTVERVQRAPDGRTGILVETPGLLDFDALGETWAFATRPLWGPLLISGAVPGAALLAVLQTPAVLRHRRRQRAGRCPGCGYDLTETRGRCPECGRRITAADRQRPAGSDT